MKKRMLSSQKKNKKKTVKYYIQCNIFQSNSSFKLFYGSIQGGQLKIKGEVYDVNFICVFKCLSALVLLILDTR